MNYQKILADKIVTDEYDKIDKANIVPFNHGLKHVTNVTKIMEKLTKVLKIIGDEKEDLLIACALHDIGQVETRENHGYNSKFFAKKYLEEQIESTRLEKILLAIEFHDHKENMDKLPLFTNLVAFADKMDFTKDRLDDGWEQKVSPEYKSKLGKNIYKEILDIDFNENNNNFIVMIKTTGKITAEDMLNEHVFFHKTINSTKAMADKLGLQSEILIDGKSVLINTIDSIKR